MFSLEFIEDFKIHRPKIFIKKVLTLPQSFKKKLYLFIVLYTIMIRTNI